VPSCRRWTQPPRAEARALSRSVPSRDVQASAGAPETAEDVRGRTPGRVIGTHAPDAVRPAVRRRRTTRLKRAPTSAVRAHRRWRRQDRRAVDRRHLRSSRQEGHTAARGRPTPAGPAVGMTGGCWTTTIGTHLLRPTKTRQPGEAATHLLDEGSHAVRRPTPTRVRAGSDYYHARSIEPARKRAVEAGWSPDQLRGGDRRASRAAICPAGSPIR
jgi:hypothetical protein